MSLAIARPRPLPDPFVLLTGVLVFGYLLMSRTFAHWGLRPVYVGEAALAAYLLIKPASLAWPWLSSLAVPSRFSAFSWWLAASLVYGMLECMRALLAGSSAVIAGEIFAFNFYPLYLFPGVWAGKLYPRSLPTLMRALAWCHGIYGVAYILVFAPMGLTQSPDDPSIVGWVGHPAGTPIVLLGLLAFERNLWRGAVPFLLNLLVLFGMQRRAEWLAFGMAVTAWACMTGQLKRLAYGGLIVGAVLVIGLLPGVKFPSPSLRGESMSTWDLVSRAIAPIDPDTAEKFSRDADVYAGTASWRTEFWTRIWEEVHATDARTVFGLGYDYPLWLLHPEVETEHVVRTPHNVFMFALGYSGWLGVLIFFGMQWALARMLWRKYRETGVAFGFCLWILTIAWAAFDPLLERPFGAIPLYLLMGMALMQTGVAVGNETVPSMARPTGLLAARRWRNTAANAES